MPNFSESVLFKGTPTSIETNVTVMPVREAYDVAVFFS